MWLMEIQSALKVAFNFSPQESGHLAKRKKIAAEKLCVA